MYSKFKFEPVYPIFITPVQPKRSFITLKLFECNCLFVAFRQIESLTAEYIKMRDQQADSRLEN